MHNYYNFIYTIHKFTVTMYILYLHRFQSTLCGNFMLSSYFKDAVTSFRA